METPLGAPPASAELVSHRPPGALVYALPTRFLWGFFVDSLHRKKTWSDFPKICFRFFEKIFFKKLKKYFRKNLIKIIFDPVSPQKKLEESGQAARTAAPVEVYGPCLQGSPQELSEESPEGFFTPPQYCPHSVPIVSP